MSTGLAHLGFRLKRWWVLRCWQHEINHLTVLHDSLVNSIEYDQAALASVQLALGRLAVKMAAAQSMTAPRATMRPATTQGD